MKDSLEDTIEAQQALHGADGKDLHFRFIGNAKHRCFIVNVQFAAADERTKEDLCAEEYDIMIRRLLTLILRHLGDTRSAASH